MITNYEIWLCDDREQRLLQINDFVSFQYVKIVNGVGQCVLVLPATFNSQYFRVDGFVQILRNGRMDWVGLMRSIQIEQDADGQSTILTSVGLNDLLRRRIVAYAAGTSQADKSGYADNMMKAVVRENLGAQAGSERDLSAFGLSVQQDLSQGPTIHKSFAWRRVLDVLQEISDEANENGTPVYFDIIWNGQQRYEFQTFLNQRGIDRTNFVFSTEWGNLEEPTVKFAYDNEVNYVYAGGQGEGTSRLIVEVGDSARVGRSVWNRCESFADARNSETEDGVRVAAQRELSAGQPRQAWAGRIVDIPSSRYGVHFDIGDRVSVSLPGFGLYTAMIKTIKISVDVNGERIEASLDG
jgi:hypothetical protein